MKKVILASAAIALLGAGSMAQAVTIDGTIDVGEWLGAASYTIGGGGGTAYFKADTNYIYGAFDITGWTTAMGADSGGNLLGFGAWKVNGQSGSGKTGVEFQQSTTAAAWGGDGNSGTMNGLVSAFRLNGQIPPAGSIPGDLQAMDLFATGHRVWEVKMPIGTMGVKAGDTVWVVGGINYDKATHWYPAAFPTTWSQYAPVNVEASPAVPEPAFFQMGALLGMSGLGCLKLRRKA